MADADRERIRISRRKLECQYAHVGGDGEYEALAPVSESSVERDVRVPQAPDARASTSSRAGLDASVRQSRRIHQNPYAHVDGNGEHDRVGRKRVQVRPRTLKEIDVAVRAVHRRLWRTRPAGGSAFGILDPALEFERAGFAVLSKPSLGEMDADGGLVAVAGILDCDNFQVHCSESFSPEVRRFTLAHELGHLVLEHGTGLHRDRALDGSLVAGSRDFKEREADRFAARFLMPEGLVRSEFQRRFGDVPFRMTEDAAFGLGDRARAFGTIAEQLARATHFHGEHFVSLAQQFQVTVTTMTIRLTEIGLVAH